MKNIHVLPTDKPSKLFKDDFGKYFISINIDQEQNHFKPQHIYITSDEEVKEGDYFLYDGTKIRYKSNGTEYHGRDLCHISGNHRYPVSESKKIILTTDQDLIKNGVQKIDDEFLEWFVENPSCEEVEISEDYFKPSNMVYGHNMEPYKIIIPQEEPKQETLEEAAELYEKTRVAHDELYVESNDIEDLKASYYYKGRRDECIKWQAKRMYSEEEVQLILSKLLTDIKNGNAGNSVEWFEQFKNKGGDK
jgi:hypothetical protein